MVGSPAGKVHRLSTAVSQMSHIHQLTQCTFCVSSFLWVSNLSLASLGALGSGFPMTLQPHRASQARPWWHRTRLPGHSRGWHASVPATGPVHTAPPDVDPFARDGGSGKREGDPRQKGRFCGTGHEVTGGGFLGRGGVFRSLLWGRGRSAEQRGCSVRLCEDRAPGPTRSEARGDPSGTAAGTSPRGPVGSEPCEKEGRKELQTSILL